MKKYNKLSISILTALTVGFSQSVLAQNKKPVLINEENTQSIQSQSNALTQQQVLPHPKSPGIIVKYKEGSRSRTANEAMRKTEVLAQKVGANLAFNRMMSGDAEVLSLEKANKSLKADINDIVAVINALPNVEYAEVDELMIPYITPNDPRYNDQWHYSNSVGGMKLPGAWDETTGSTAVTVAVVDTGYRPHPDLVDNIVGEYDMISSPEVARDGDGRDANGRDRGDWVIENECGNNPAQDSSWHGTHVAGTVAAESDNGSGVAGVAWDVNLVSVRVLGACGGSGADVADGIRWAAGLNVPGVPANPNPADVINLSLGSSVPSNCSNTYANAINAAVGAGATVVVAAGNDNSIQGYSPANCPNVIAVAAGGTDGSRAYYSNYGGHIDITAPGGDGCDPDTNAYPTSLSDCKDNAWRDEDMILSTHNGGATTPGSNTYAWMQGTSMAAPHIAGLAGLIKSVDGSLTPAEVEQIIKDTASPFANVDDHQCNTNICGDGYANAAAAVAAAAGECILSNGVPYTGLSGAEDSEMWCTLEVPAGASNLIFNLTSGNGIAWMSAKHGSPAGFNDLRNCRSFRSPYRVECKIENVQAGTYYVWLHGYTSYSNFSVEANYAMGSEQDLFINTTNTRIPDNDRRGVTSSIEVDKRGMAGRIEVKYDIIHSWRGDLKVVLVASDGSKTILHSRTNPNDSRDDLRKTAVLDASDIDARGEWKLLVKDLASGDTGYINSWSIEFN